MKTASIASTILIAATVVMTSASVVHANATSDANAALATLQSGDNDGAIALFTRALNEGLRGDDKEFAYAMRGQAYLNKGNYSLAISDLDKARQMKPDDDDAQKNLVVAICKVQPASLIAGRSASSYANEVGNTLGKMLLGGVALSLQQQTGVASPVATAGPGPGCQ